MNTPEIIKQSLHDLLEIHPIKCLHFADSSLAPPPLAYVTPFPRLAIPISGVYPVEIARSWKTRQVDCVPGDGVFVGRHCWDRPRWTQAVSVLTILFGKKQIGFSLVTHDGVTDDPEGAIKCSVPISRDSLPANILDTLISLNDPFARESIGPLLAGALLHSCALILKKPEASQPKRAGHTYDAICLYVQENYQQQITRDSVAEHFGLHPCHISRLFHDEGHMHFSDYINLVRIERAKFLLKNYDMPMKEISSNCGFSDTAYFCRVFRALTGITPTTYRLQGL
ncbi:MAG: AraC family transcriptional regulator [Armatimonadota bacterium]|nr:AraC family transcriptional regulator [bacterium]